MPQKGSASNAPERPPCVLIVDDERANRDLLKVMLAPEGFLLLTASSGEEALALLAHQPPDLILLDVMMPGMDGYEVAGKIKGNPDTNSVPIIMVTAMDDHKARLLGLNAGVEDFLTKPVDRAELRVRVKNLLKLKMYGDKLRATLAELEAANESLDRRTREIEMAQAVAGATTARLARLQKITAALGSTVTQDEVAESVLREAIIALECEAGAVVIKNEEGGELTLLRESGSLDSFMRSFKQVHPPRSRGPYARAVEKCRSLYLESFEEMVTQYPAFRERRQDRFARRLDISSSRDKRQSGRGACIRILRSPQIHAVGQAVRRHCFALLRAGARSRQTSHRRRGRDRGSG